MTENSSGDALVGFVDYEHMIARLENEYPSIPREHIENIAHSEYDAVVGNRLYVVPVVVEEGTRERLGMTTFVETGEDPRHFDSLDSAREGSVDEEATG